MPLGRFRKKNSLKFNGTHQLLVYADDDGILGGSIYSYTIEKHAEPLVVKQMPKKLSIWSCLKD
jgi:hypothetical protein